MKRFRIAVGDLTHESSSFIPGATPLEWFNRHSCSPEEMFQLGDANTIVDGLVRGVRDEGLELVALSCAEANSGGLPTRATFDILLERLLAPLRAAVPVDGILLSLHGAFAVEGLPDADGEVLRQVRMLVGPNCPIMAVNDLHSNLSPLMAAAANALIVERTYPHVDMAERGVDAARLMARTLRGEVRPTMAFRPLPLFWAAANMITGEPPMRDAIAQVEDLLRVPGVLSASLSVGYQWVDSPIVGTSIVVVTDNDPAAAGLHAERLASWVWERREIWQRPPFSPADALARGEALGRFPIILADQADNPGGGAPGDSTEILRLFIERDLRDAAVLYMVDPQTVAAAKQAGVGAQVLLQVGGKSHPLLGPPVELTAEVVSLSDGRFVYDGPMWQGVEERVGDAALLRHRGVSILAISVAQQPVDLALARSLGLDCRALRYLCLKSTGHFRSGFEPIAGSIHNVDAVGLLTHDFKKLPYQNLARKIYPIDADASIDWT